MTQTDEAQKSILGKAQDYLGLLTEIKKRIHSAQYEALKAVNRELIGLYWDIGRMIVERQNSEGWGKSVVEKLSADLRREFPGVGGFSVQNLWYMRQFYSEYHDNERLQPLVGEIAWAHNLAIMSKCKDPLEREFYIRMTRLVQKRTPPSDRESELRKIFGRPDQFRADADARPSLPS
jgi:predicted nuclease of restriction endonuclease-like (RecB) superfamily